MSSLRHVHVLAILTAGLVATCGGGVDLHTMMDQLIEEGVVSCDQPVEGESMIGCSDVILSESLDEDAMGFYLASMREQGEPVICGDGWHATGPNTATLDKVAVVLGGEPC